LQEYAMPWPKASTPGKTDFLVITELNAVNARADWALR
jgi:hypothetical protein